MFKEYDYNIDPVYNTNSFMVQINDHNNKKVLILDRTFKSYEEAVKEACNHIEKIGARRQLGDKRSSKPSPSVSIAGCVGSIPTAPAVKLESK